MRETDGISKLLWQYMTGYRDYYEKKSVPERDRVLRQGRSEGEWNNREDRTNRRPMHVSKHATHVFPVRPTTIDTATTTTNLIGRKRGVAAVFVAIRRRSSPAVLQEGRLIQNQFKQV